MRTRLPILAMALLITLTACGTNQAKVAGKDQTKVAQANGSPKSGQQESKQGQQAPTQNSTPGNKTSQTTGVKNNASQSSPSPAPTFNNTLPMETELNPTCGSRGTLMALKIQTRKGASLSIAVSYSNGKNYGNYFVGHADNEGRFTYTWIIPAEAPIGNAKVVVGAGDRSSGPDEYSAYSTGESSLELVPFRVAISC